MAEPVISEPQPATTLPGVLADIADELSAIDDWRTRLLHVVCLIADHFPASTVSVGLQMEHWEVISCVESADPDALSRSLQQAHSMLASPVPGISRAPVSPTGDTGVPGSSLAIPVIAANETLGILAARSPTLDAFGPDDIGSIAAAALMVGSFTRRILTHEAEEVAREKLEGLAAQLADQIRILQQSLVPRKAEIAKGYRVASAYIPGGEGSEIGGDFYDLFDTRDGSIGLILGDVTGKGIGAVTLAVATRSTIRAYLYDTSSPESALTLANQMLFGLDPFSGTFVTVIVMIIDPASGRLTYSSAGHPPPVLLRAASGQTELLSGTGTPVGVLADTAYSRIESHLDPGDKIVVYTDGISEARQDALLFGEEGIGRVLQDRGDLPPEEFLHVLLAEAGTWSNHHLTDDIAAIVIERNPT